MTREITKIIIHCSATQPKADIGVLEIDTWHRKRGFRKVGYHFVIRRDGILENGRLIKEIGAHAKGYNKTSIGICLVGGVDADGKAEKNFTPAQMASLKTLVTALTSDYPKAEVLGHRDLPKVTKACPCFSVRAWWRDCQKSQPELSN